MVTLSIVAALAFVLGVAIQRGTTCAVLAVEEIIRHRRADRFLGFFECGMWASLTLFVTSHAGSGWHAGPSVPLILAGAIVFGCGAAINGACAFGTIGRLGNGRLEYLLTGFMAWASLKTLASLDLSLPHEDARPGDTGMLSPLVVVMLLTGLVTLRWVRHSGPFHAFAHLGTMMALIGAVGTLLGLIHQPWPWITILTAVPDIDAVALAGLACLIGGAVTNGIVERKFSLSRPSLTDLVRRGSGGMMMGIGIFLIPGGNDSLVLYGIPTGSLSAITTYAVMLLAIAATLKLIDGVSPPWRKSTSECV